jgi:hypothetical protein
MSERQRDSWAMDNGIYMSFTDALEDFLDARNEVRACSEGSVRWHDATRKLNEAKRHLNKITDSPFTYGE